MNSGKFLAEIFGMDFYNIRNVSFRVSISLRDLAGSRMVYISYLSRLYDCTYLATASATS